MPSKMASEMADAEWAAEKQSLLPMLTELTITSEETGAAADAELGMHAYSLILRICYF